MNSELQALILSATFLRQARELCACVLKFRRGDAEQATRLEQLGVALEQECAHIEQLISTQGFGGVENSFATEADDKTLQPSRIEQLNAELAECERLSHQLDELTTTFDSASIVKTTEDVILRTNADHAEKRLLDKIESLSTCLASEQPTTMQETLIFILRAMAPLQELIMAVSEDAYERKQGHIACRMPQGAVASLEKLADVTSAELGFEAPQSEAEIIDKLREALAQKAAIPLEGLH